MEFKYQKKYINIKQNILHKKNKFVQMQKILIGGIPQKYKLNFEDSLENLSLTSFILENENLYQFMSDCDIEPSYLSEIARAFFLKNIFGDKICIPINKNKSLFELFRFFIGKILFDNDYKEQILKCLNQKDKFTVIFFGINLEMHKGHANVIIVDNNNKMAYHFEPYGQTFMENETKIDWINKDVHIYKSLEKEFNNMGIEYKSPLLICPKFGPQYISENEIKNFVSDIDNGWCILWSFFFSYVFLDIKTQFDDVSVEDIFLKSMDILVKDFGSFEKMIIIFFMFTKKYILNAFKTDPNFKSLIEYCAIKPKTDDLLFKNDNHDSFNFDDND